MYTSTKYQQSTPFESMRQIIGEVRLPTLLTNIGYMKLPLQLDHLANGRVGSQKKPLATDGFVVLDCMWILFGIVCICDRVFMKESGHHHFPRDRRKRPVFVSDPKGPLGVWLSTKQ